MPSILVLPCIVFVTLPAEDFFIKCSQIDFDSIRGRIVIECQGAATCSTESAKGFWRGAIGLIGGIGVERWRDIGFGESTILRYEASAVLPTHRALTDAILNELLVEDKHRGAECVAVRLEGASLSRWES